MSRAHAHHGYGRGTEFPGISTESNGFVGADVALNYMQQQGEQGLGLESSTALGVWAYIHHEQAPLAHALARIRVSAPDQLIELCSISRAAQTWDLRLICTHNGIRTSRTYADDSASVEGLIEALARTQAIDLPAHVTFTVPIERDDGTFAVPRGMRLFRVDALVPPNRNHPSLQTVHVAELGRLATGLARKLHNVIKPEDEHEPVDDDALFASLIRIVAWYDLVQHVNVGDSHAEAWVEGAERFEADYYADMRDAVRALYQNEKHRVVGAVERLYEHRDFDRHHWETRGWDEDRMVIALK